MLIFICYDFIRGRAVSVVFNQIPFCRCMNLSGTDGGWPSANFRGTWWRHQMETFPPTGPLWGKSIGHRNFCIQSTVTRSFDVFFDLRLNKRFSKPSRCRWLETPSRSLWHHCSDQQLPQPMVKLWHGNIIRILEPFAKPPVCSLKMASNWQP